jgi:hypothetical protein
MMRAAVLVLLVLVATGCVRQPVSPTGISAEAARATATREAGSTIPAVVLSTRLSTYGTEAMGGTVVEAGTPVWVVLLSGSFPTRECGRITVAPSPCLAASATAVVLIDALTGRFVQEETPGPAPS